VIGIVKDTIIKNLGMTSSGLLQPLRLFKKKVNKSNALPSFLMVMSAPDRIKLKPISNATNKNNSGTVLIRDNEM